MLPSKILAYITENQLFDSQSRLLLAVSGGRDSVVLLDILVKLGFQVAVAHANFQLRGAESNQDADFVEALAKQYQIPFFSKRFDTAQYAEENNLSIQVSARDLRYSWFAEILEKEGYHVLATAHHANDNIETVLHRLVRGTGVAGLQGIPLKAQFAGAGKVVVRPLLATSQTEITEYAQENALLWREDSSNQTDKYTRNLLRHKVVPVLQSLNPNLEQTFQLTLERIKGYVAHWQASSEKLKADSWEEKNQAIFIQIAPLLQHAAGKVLLAEWLQPFGFNYETTQNIWQKIQENATGTLFRSDTHSIVIDRSALVLTPKTNHEQAIYELAYPAPCLHTPNFTLNVRYQKHTPTEKPTLGGGDTGVLDLERLAFPLTVRRWREGDFFYPLGMQGRKKKISDFLNDQKVPRNLKNEVWVLCTGTDIAWVIGYRIAHPFRITEKTQNLAIFHRTGDSLAFF